MSSCSIDLTFDCCSYLIDVFLLSQRYVDSFNFFFVFSSSCAVSIDSYNSVNNLTGFITCGLLITAVILLLNCLVLILYLYIHFFVFTLLFLLYFNKNDTVCSESLLIFVLFHLVYNFMVSNAISPGCGVQESMMLV